MKKILNSTADYVDEMLAGLWPRILNIIGSMVTVAKSLREQRVDQRARSGS